MERSKFLEAFHKASDQLDKRGLHKLIARSIKASDEWYKDEPSGQHDLIIVMEELAELSQQVSKYLRGMGDKPRIMEEMADVAIELVYLQHICGISTPELYAAMNVKLGRLERVLNDKGVYL